MTASTTSSSTASRIAHASSTRRPKTLRCQPLPFSSDLEGVADASGALSTDALTRAMSDAIFVFIPELMKWLASDRTRSR